MLFKKRPDFFKAVSCRKEKEELHGKREIEISFGEFVVIKIKNETCDQN